MIQGQKQRKGSRDHVIVTPDHCSQAPSSLWGASLVMPSRSISDRVFEVIRSEMPPSNPKRDRFLGLAPLEDIGTKETKEYDSNGFKVNPKPLKKRSTVTVRRDKFLSVVCDALAQYQYLGPKQQTDLMVACRIRDRKESVTVLLCGTSGCGNSTLDSLLAGDSSAEELSSVTQLAGPVLSIVKLRPIAEIITSGSLCSFLVLFP